MIFLLLLIAEGFDISKIPASGVPPSRRFQTLTVFDADLNRLITFGGYDAGVNSYLSSITTFDLTTYTWGIISPESSLNPPPSGPVGVFLTSNRKLLTFFGQNTAGLSSDVYSFDLNTYSWRNEILTGDLILGRGASGFVAFTYLNTDYVAIYGGLTRNGLDTNLYL